MRVAWGRTDRHSGFVSQLYPTTAIPPINKSEGLSPLSREEYDEQRRQREEEIDRERPLLGPVGAVNMSAMPPGDGAV